MKRRVILIEGSENCGKSTIGKLLGNILNIQYFKNPDEKSSFNSEEAKYRYTDQRFFANVLRENNQSIILDRSIYSDLVYTKIFRPNNYTEKFINKVYEIDKIFKEIGVYIIFCYKYNNNIEDDLIDKKYYKSIQLEFQNVMLKTKNKVLHLDTTNEDINNQLYRIIKWM